MLIPVSFDLQPGGLLHWLPLKGAPYNAVTNFLTQVIHIETKPGLSAQCIDQGYYFKNRIVAGRTTLLGQDSSTTLCLIPTQPLKRDLAGDIMMTHHFLQVIKA